MKGPGLFSDIGKKARDLLTGGYSYDQKLIISGSTASGVGLTSAGVRKGGHYSFDVGTRFKYKNTLIDIKVDTDSNIFSTLTVSEILPSTKAIATFEPSNHDCGKLEVQYFHDHMSLASAVTFERSPVEKQSFYDLMSLPPDVAFDLMSLPPDVAFEQPPVVGLSGTVGAQGVVLGAEAAFDTASGTFTKCSAGISLKQTGYDASIILEDKGDTLKASYLYHLDEKQKKTLAAEISMKLSIDQNTATVGGSFAVNPQTTVKSRLNSHGKLAALVQHELRPKSLLTISGEFDTSDLDRDPRFGLALALKR